MPEPDPTRGLSPLTFTPEPYSAPAQTYSQWSSAAGAGVSDPLTSYVGYADYQRGHYLATGELDEEVEQSIQSGLAGVLVENNLTTQEELPQYLAPRTSSSEQDAALVRRAFGNTAGAEYTQALSDGSADESTLRKQLNDAKTSLVETGQLSFARLTNDEGAHEIIGGGLDSSAFDTAVRDGALSYADAYMVAQGLKKSGTTGETYFERRANHKLRGELDKLVTSGTDNYTKDAVDTVSDFLKAEDKGDISNINLSSQIALVRRDLARQYGEENQFDPEALRSRYSDDQIRQSLEETAISRLNFESGFEYHDDVGDEHKNIRITERGNTFVHPSLMMQKERFERAIASDTRLSAEQRLMAHRSRDVYRETMFSHYDKMLTETNATSDEWLKMKTAGRVQGAADVDILDAFLMDGDNYSSFSNKMGAVAASVWDAVAGIFAGVGAIVFKSEGATNTLVEIQRDAARRQEVASLFGKDFGFGMDVATTIAPMVADVAATALLSSFTLGAGGAAYLTVKTGASVTAKGLVKNLTGRMMLRKGLAGGTRESAEEVAERLFAHKLISSASREASEKGVMDAINAYNKVVSNKLFKKTLGPAGMVPQFLGAANRQAGSSYATIYSSLPEDMTHDEKHDHAFGYAMLSGTITGLITAAFMGIGRGGFESAFLARLTPRQSRQALKHLVGAADDLPETVLANKFGESLGESLKQVSRRAFPEFLKSGMEEFFEEGFDEFINSFVMDIALDEDTPMIDKVMGALHAGAVGGVIGSGAAGLRSGLSRIKGPRGEYELYQEEQIDAALKKLEESGSPLSAEVIRDVKEFMLKDARDRDAAEAPTLEAAPAEEAPAEEAPTDDIPAEALDNATTPEAMEEALNKQLDDELDAQSEEPMTASSAATAGGADTKPLRKPTSTISNVLEQLAALSNRVKVRARKFTPAKSSVKFTRGQFIEDENTSAEVTAFNKAVLDGVPLVLESGKNGMPERTELPEGYYEGKTQLLNELIAQKYPAIPVPTKGTKAWQGVDGEKGRVDANGIGEFDNVPPTVVAMLRAGIPVKAPAVDAKDVNPSFIYDVGGDFITGVRINTGEGGVKLVRLNRVESPLPDFEENLQRASAVLNLFKSTGTVPSEDIEGAAKELADALDADIATNATASLEVEANLALRLLDLLKDLDGTAGTMSPDQTAYADPTDTAVGVLMNRLALWVPAGQAKQQAADILAKNLPITVDPKTDPDGVLKAFLRDFVMNDTMLGKGELDLSAVTDRVKRRYTVIQNTHRNADASQYPDAPYTAKLTDSKVAATIDSRAVDVVPNNILQASADLDASPPLREALNKALDALGVTTPEKLSSDAALGVLLRNDLMRNPQAPAPEVLAFYEAAKAATLKGNYRALRLLGRWTDTVDGDLRLDWEFVSDIKAGAEAVIGSQMSDDQTVTLINAVRNESLTLYSRSRPTSANAKRAVIANGNEVERLELESDDPASVIKAFKKIANDKRASKESRTAAKLLLRNKNLIMGVEFRIRKSGNGYAGKYIRYDDGTHAVELYLDGHGAGGVEGVLLHEYVHALTAVVLTAPDSSLTPAQRAARDELIAVFEEAQAAVLASDNSAFAPSVENVSEFVAHVFTSPEFQAFLKTHKTADTQTNFFQRIMDSILRFLAVKATMDKPTLHRDALAAVTGFTDTLTKTGRDSASAVAGEVAQDTRSKLDRTRRVLSEHPAISVTHGSASMETFDQLSNDFMGTGEGAQMNGWGTYLGDIEEVTRQYQDQGASRSIRVVYKNNRHTENLGATMRRLVQSRRDASAKYGENSPQYKYASKVELEAYLLLRGLRNAARDRKASTDTEEKAQADFEEYLADIRSAILGSQYSELGVIYRALSDVENIQDIEYSTGTHYRVDIELETDELLAWDRSLDEQSLYIQMALGSSDNPSIQAAYDSVFQTEQLLGKQVGIATGAKFYRALADELGSPRAASQLLASIGIRGNRFFDGDTRGRAESQLGANEDSANYAIPENPTYNYVIFDDSVLTTTTIEDPHGNEQQLLRLRTQTGSQEGFAPPTEEERQEADRLMLMMGNVFARFGIDFTFEWGEGGGAAYYDVASKKVVVEKLSVIATMREVGGLGAIEQVLLGIAREESGHRASRKGISKKMFKAAMDELSGKEYLDISENYFGGVDPDRSKRKYVEQVLAGEEVPEAFGLPNNPEGMKEYLLEEKLRMDWQRRRYGYTTEETYNFYKDKPNATQVVIRYLKGLINRFQEYIKVYGDDSALAEAVNELVEQTNAMYGAQRIPRMDFNPDEPDEFVQQLASQIGQLSMTPRADSRLERVVESVEQSRRALYDVSKEVEPNEPVPEIVLHDTKQDFDSAMDAISKGRAAQRFTETGRWVPTAGEGARGQVHINLEHASNSTVAQEVFNAVFDLRTPETEDKANAGAEMLIRMRNILLTGSRRDVEISEALDKLLMRSTLQSDTTWTNRGGEYIADLAGYAARIHSHLSKATRDRLNQWLNSFTDKFSGEPVIDSDESFISFMSSFARSAGESAGLIGVEGYVDQYSSGGVMKTLELAEEESVPLTDRPITISAGALTQQSSVGWIKGVEGAGDWFQDTNVDMVDVEKLFEKFRKDNSGRDPAVWVWMTDQLKRGEYVSPVTDGLTETLQGGVGFALDPDNQTDNRLWASGMPPKELQERIDASDFIWLATGAPMSSHNFSRGTSEVWVAEIEAAMQRKIKAGKASYEILTGTKEDTKRETVTLTDGSLEEFAAIMQKYIPVLGEGLTHGAKTSWGKINTALAAAVKGKEELLGNTGARGRFAAEMFRDSMSNSLREGTRFHFVHNFLGVPTKDVVLPQVLEPFHINNENKQGDLVLLLEPEGIKVDDNFHDSYPHTVTGKVVGIPTRKFNIRDVAPQDLIDKSMELTKAGKVPSLVNQLKTLMGDSPNVYGAIKGNLTRQWMQNPLQATSIGAMPDTPIASQENMVGAASGVLSKLIAPEVDYPQRLEYHNQINAAIIGEDGEDRIAQAIGIDSPKLMLTLPSIWIPESGIPEINPADAMSGFSTKEHAQLYAIIRGVVTQQNAIGGSRAKYIKDSVNIEDVINDDADGNTKLAYFLPISKGKRTEKLLTDVHRGLNGNDTAVFHRPDGLLIAHLAFDPEYTPTIFDNDTEKIAKALGTEQFRLPTEVFYAENEFEEQDTERVQNIRNYGTGFGLVKDKLPSDITRRPSDIQRRLGNLVKDIQDVNNEFSAKGFGKAGDLPTRVGSYFQRSSVGAVDRLLFPERPLTYTQEGLLKINGKAVSKEITEFVQGLESYAEVTIREDIKKGIGGAVRGDTLVVDGAFELDLNDELMLMSERPEEARDNFIRLRKRSEYENIGLTVDAVKALKKGSGVRALRLLTTVADDLGVTIYGTANAFGTVEGEKGLSTDELIRFYKHFGFTFDKLGNGYRVPIPKSPVIKLKGFRRVYTSIGAVEISTEGETEAGVAVDWAGNRNDLIAFLEDRMNDADKKIKADVEKTYNNNPTKQDREPYLAVAFNMMQDGRINGRISNAQYRGIVQTLDPWVPNKEIPSAPSMELIKEFLEDRKLVKSVKQQAHLLLTNKQQRDLLKDGRFQVSLRLDIPAYTASVTDKKYKGAPVYVVTMYEGSSNGIVMGYAGFSYTKGVTFTTKETPEGDPVSLKTAGGKGKGTFAFVDGTLEKLSLAEFEKWRKGEDSKVLGNKSEWTEVGYNPLRSSEFVDLTEGANFLRPVVGADEAINVGNRVYVKGNVKHGVVPEYDPAGARQYSSIGAIDDMFFSGVEETISDLMPAKASASQVKGILKGKVKKAEVEWLGMDEWLADRESVTRDEVMAFIDENKVHIEEVDTSEVDTSDEDNRFREGIGEEPKYEEYTLAGGENYREFLITMPDREGLPTVLQRDYTSPHWGGTQNVVVHIRVKDRVTEDGKKVLHIEEIQSDWAGDIRHAGTRDAGEIARLGVEFQEAKEARDALKEEWSQDEGVQEDAVMRHAGLSIVSEGSRDANSRIFLVTQGIKPSALPRKGEAQGTEIKLRLKAYVKETFPDIAEDVKEGYFSKAEGKLGAGERKFWTAKRLEQRKKLSDKYNDLHGKIEAAKGAVADMPFVNNYHELALKRILRRAAVEGYEGVTWSTGKSQIELYNEALRQNVSEIKWWSNSSKNVVALQWYNADAGEWIDADVALNGKTEAGLAEGKTLEDVVGGKIAKQIREGEAQGTVEGDDLSIGGHFHKLIYDQMIPTALRKLTKRWGGEVTETVVAHGDYTPQSKGSRHNVHQLLFTEGMAEGAQQVHALHTSVGAFDGTNINYGKDIVDMMNVPVFETDGYRKQAKKGWRRWLQNAFKGTLDPRVHRLLEQRDQIRRAVQHDLERWNSEMEKIIKEEYTSKDEKPPLDKIQILSGSQENVSVHDEVKRIRKQYDAEVNALQDQLAEDTISAEEFGNALDVAKEKKETLERDVLLQKRKEFRALKAKTITDLRKTAGGKRVILHVRSLRKTVDRLTQKLKDDYGIEGELGLTMDANMGIYLTKSYRMFTDAGWAKQVLNDPNPDFENIRQDASEYFETIYVRERTRQIRVDDPALSYAKAKKLAEKELKDNPTIGDSMMRAFVASYDKDSTLEGDAVRHKDNLKALIDSFKGRKELPEELSALLGEHTESTGYNSLLRTYMHVGIMASHQAFLNHVKQLGMDSGWILTRDQFNALGLGVKGSGFPKEGYTEIKGSTTTKYDPFNVDGRQLYAPAEMVDNLKALLDPVAMGNMANAAVKTASDLTKTASVLTGLSLGAKTMGSIGFFVRNVVSNIAFFGPAQGLGWGTTGKMGGHLVKELRRRVFRMTPEERSVYYTELTALGIIGDEIRPQLFDELMSGQTTEQSLLKGMDTLLGDFPQDEDVVAKTGRNKLVKKLGKLKTLSSSVDAFYKIAMFEHELRVMEQARDARAGDKYESMSDDELKQEASIKVKMTAQSYSQAPPFIEGWSRSPLGVLFAPFLRFKMEVPRIIFNTQKLWAEEIATGNPVLVKRGKARRKGFMLTSIGFSMALPTAMRVMLMGIGEDEDEALRDSIPEYLRTNTFFYLPTSDGGKVSFDLTFMNPFAIMADPILRFTEHMVRGEPAEGGAVFFKALIANQYLDEQIFAGAVRSTIANNNPETNRPIWESYDSPLESFGKSMVFLFNEAYAPKTPAAIAGSITKMVNGVDPVGTGDFLRSPAGAMLAELLPIKPHKIELDKQLNRFLAERRDEYNRASGRKNVLLTDNPVSSEEIKDIAIDEIEARIAINQHMMRAFRGFEGLGMTKAEIFAHAKERGVGKERLTLLFAGLMDRPMLTPPYIERMAAKGSEHIKRLRELHAEFKTHPRYIPLD